MSKSAYAGNPRHIKSLLLAGVAPAFGVLMMSAAPAQAQEAASVGEVVVTASRIIRPGFTAPTPITTVGVEEVQTRAFTNVTNLVNELPSARPTVGSFVGPASSGASFVNLRGLGQTRTLMLVASCRPTPPARPT